MKAEYQPQSIEPTVLPASQHRARGNGHPNGQPEDGAPDPDVGQFRTNLDDLKRELSRVRGLERTEILDKLQQIEAIGTDFEQWLSRPLASGRSGSQDPDLATADLLEVTRRLQQARSPAELLDSAARDARELGRGERALVYRFDDADPSQGTVAAEAVQRGWTPARGERLPATLFGVDTAGEYDELGLVQIGNVEVDDVTPYQRQLLEKYQVQSSVAVPLRVSDRLWGLLVVQQCGTARAGSAAEVNLLCRVAAETAVRLAGFDTRELLERQQARAQTVANVIDKVRQSQNIQTIFEVATAEVRQALQCDRVGIYQFNDDWSGGFVAEAVTAGWTPVVTRAGADPAGEVANECSIRYLGVGREARDSRDTYLRDTRGGGYARGQKYSVVSDVYAMGFSRCYLNQLEAYQARAYINVPIFQGDKLWGLFAAYQNTGPRQWSDADKDLMLQIADQFAIALRQAEYIDELQSQARREAAVAERERVKLAIVSRIRESRDTQQVFEVATAEVRQLLCADRAGLYKFNADWSGGFVAEAATPGWTPLLGSTDPAGSVDNECSIRTLASGATVSDRDTYLKDTAGGGYARGQKYSVVNDVYAMGFSRCYLNQLEAYQARAYINVPVFQGTKLWGLFAVYQNSGPRVWTDDERDLMVQIADQLAIALKQAEYVDELQSQAERQAVVAERERVKSAIVDRIRQALDINSIFDNTTKELRKVLACDRVGIYKFNDDWSGGFVAESLTGGWTALVNARDADPAGEVANDCTLRTLGSNLGDIRDTYLQDTQGGGYARGQKYSVVNDVYAMGFSRCYLNQLEAYEARAYINVPIFQGTQLWGLLAAYQNSGPRAWREEDKDLMLQVSDQMGVALQQAEFLAQLQQKSDQLAESVEREKAVARVVDRIRETPEVNAIFETTTKEVRSLLKADRVALYQFDAEFAGEFVAESVAGGWKNLVGTPDAKVRDTYLKDNRGGRYVNNEHHAIDDIYRAGFDDCHVRLLESFEARAYVLVPVFQDQQLWGLLSVYQNSGPRTWQEGEIQLLRQIGTQLGIALKQAEYLAQIQAQSAQLAESAERERTARELLQRRAIDLLTAVRPALDGDLTVRAPITSDELGTIADAYNNTLQGLRQIVVQVQNASTEVAQSATNSDVAINDLSARAQEQSQALAQALEQVQSMALSNQNVASSAQSIQSAVQRSNQTVSAGDGAMNRTVDGIQAIREAVAETSRNIRQLGESSQKISRVVNLIGDFSKQTQLLSLNASIEATRAGEYGRGFAVVADEVRSLARQSADATTEIENLVAEIRTQTTEAIKVTERAIAQVSAGTNLVQETRAELNAIAAVSTDIEQLVAEITDATLAQLEQSRAVSATVQEVAAISEATSAESQSLSASFKASLATAEQLQSAVDKFKI